MENPQESFALMEDRMNHSGNLGGLNSTQKVKPGHRIESMTGLLEVSVGPTPFRVTVTQGERAWQFYLIRVKDLPRCRSVLPVPV
jgi:hypothetical protein